MIIMLLSKDGILASHNPGCFLRLQGCGKIRFATQAILTASKRSSKLHGHQVISAEEELSRDPLSSADQKCDSKLSHQMIQAEHSYLTLTYTYVICSRRIPSRDGLHMNLRMCRCWFWKASCSGEMRFVPFQQNMQNFLSILRPHLSLVWSGPHFRFQTLLPAKILARRNLYKSVLIITTYLDSVCLNDMVDGHWMNFDDTRQQTLQIWGITLYSVSFDAFIHIESPSLANETLAAVVTYF